MYVLTIENFPGADYQVLGMVQGSTVQTVNMFKDMGAGFKTLVGGELVSYNKMLAKARELAISRMIEQANAMGADAIIGVRFSTSSITQGAAEIMVCGTAIKLQPKN